MVGAPSLTPRTTALLDEPLDSARREKVWRHASALEKQGRQLESAMLTALMLEKFHADVKPAAVKAHLNRPATAAKANVWPPPPPPVTVTRAWVPGRGWQDVDPFEHAAAAAPAPALAPAVPQASSAP